MTAFFYIQLGQNWRKYGESMMKVWGKYGESMGTNTSKAHHANNDNKNGLSNSSLSTVLYRKKRFALLVRPVATL